MKKYQYDIAISANTEQEADSKMKSLIVLASKLSAKELERLAHVVEHEPVKTALLKKP
ncbi:MAG: hypothetical protein H0U95_15410 [Bacteroidetes bacterium]|nr:hypothetical protein [Bacteroidota bacterium]